MKMIRARKLISVAAYAVLGGCVAATLGRGVDAEGLSLWILGSVIGAAVSFLPRIVRAICGGAALGLLGGAWIPETSGFAELCFALGGAVAGGLFATLFPSPLRADPSRVTECG